MRSNIEQIESLRAYSGICGYFPVWDKIESESRQMKSIAGYSWLKESYELPVINLWRNYSPRISVQRSREGHLNGDEGIISVVGHGLQIAGDTAVGFGVLAFSEAAGDFLLDLAHA